MNKTRKIKIYISVLLMAVILFALPITSYAFSVIPYPLTAKPNNFDCSGFKTPTAMRMDAYVRLQANNYVYAAIDFSDVYYFMWYNAAEDQYKMIFSRAPAKFFVSTDASISNFISTTALYPFYEGIALPLGVFTYTSSGEVIETVYDYGMTIDGYNHAVNRVDGFNDYIVACNYSGKLAPECGGYISSVLAYDHTSSSSGSGGSDVTDTSTLPGYKPKNDVEYYEDRIEDVNSFNSELNDIWDDVGSLDTGSVDDDGFRFNIQSILKSIVNSIKVIGSFLSAIGQTIVLMFEWIDNHFFENIRQWFSSIYDSIQNLAQNFINLLKENITEMFSSVWNYEVKDGVSLHSIYEFFVEKIEAIITGIEDTIAAIQNTVVGVYTGLKEIIMDIYLIGLESTTFSDGEIVNKNEIIERIETSRAVAATSDSSSALESWSLFIFTKNFFYVFFQHFFVPEDGYFLYLLEENFGDIYNVNEIMYTFNAISAFLGDASSITPVFTTPAISWNGIEIPSMNIDFGWYMDWKPYIDPVLTAIVWVFFFFRLITGLPDYLNGMPYRPFFTVSSEPAPDPATLLEKHDVIRGSNFIMK